MNKNEQTNKKSGFDCPTIATTHPRGTKLRHNADGTVTLVEPKKTTKKK